VPPIRNDIDLPACAIVVMGVSGCGKSTLGGHIAGSLSRPFLEGDEFHSARSVAKMRSGQPLCDEDRWPWLDRLGRAIGSAVTADGFAIAACSALKRSYRERLRAAAKTPLLFVLLEADRAELALRLAERPDHFMPAKLLDSQLAALERPEPDESAIVFHAYRPVDQLASSALEWARTVLAATAKA